MVSTRKKKQSNRTLLSQLDDFDQGMIIGSTASERSEDIVVNDGTNDQDFTVGTSSNNLTINESASSVKTLERCFNEKIDREMSNNVDTAEDRIQNAILTAIDNIVATKIELAIRSINASSGRDATSVNPNSERGEHAVVNASFENASENNYVPHVSNGNDETRRDFPDEVSELSASRTRFDRQSHTHHMVTGQPSQTNQNPEFLTGRTSTPRIHHYINIRTCQHKYHKTTIYQWLNKQQEVKTQMQIIPLIV